MFLLYKSLFLSPAVDQSSNHSIVCTDFISMPLTLILKHGTGKWNVQQQVTVCALAIRRLAWTLPLYMAAVTHKDYLHAEKSTEFPRSLPPSLLWGKRVDICPLHGLGISCIQEV